MKNFILIATYTYPYEYAILRTLLEKEEIPYVFENETIIGLHPFYSNALGGIKLKVHISWASYVEELIHQLNPPSSHLRII